MLRRTYHFVNKDPVCDELANLVDSVGLRGKKHTGKIAILATCAKATVDGILYGETRKPRHDTVMSIATALGFQRTWSLVGTKWNLEEELAKAREFIKKQKALMAKADKPKKKTARKRPPKKGKPKLSLVA